MIRIAVVDDDEKHIDLINSYLSKFSEEHDKKFKVENFKDGDEITQNYKPVFDIIFLDVQMNFMDGMTTAEYIRQYDENVILIFITNMAQYAIRGYTVNALSYLLKPVPYFAFSQELMRSIERLQSQNKSFMLIKNKEGVVKLDIDRILFIETYQHRLIVHTDEDEYSFIGTMKDVESELSDKHFYRCNNGYLVNLAKVTGVKDNIAFIGDHELQISRPRKKDFLNALTNYVGEGK